MPASRLPAAPFWFLRHGETDWNRRLLAQGRVEVPLNARGEAQAREAAALLRGQRIGAIHASPLGRARRTAEIVAEALGLPVRIENLLQEAAFGDREGQPMGAWFEEWVAERHTPPGGEGFAALRERAARAVADCLAASPPGPGPALLVAHGGLMRALRAEMRLERAVRTPNAQPLFCRPDGRGGWRLEALGGRPVA